MNRIWRKKYDSSMATTISFLPPVLFKGKYHGKWCSSPVLDGLQTPSDIPFMWFKIVFLFEVVICVRMWEYVLLFWPTIVKVQNTFFFQTKIWSEHFSWVWLASTILEKNEVSRDSFHVLNIYFTICLN